MARAYASASGSCCARTCHVQTRDAVGWRRTRRRAERRGPRLSPGHRRACRACRGRCSAARSPPCRLPARRNRSPGCRRCRRRSGPSAPRNRRARAPPPGRSAGSSVLSAAPRGTPAAARKPALERRRRAPRGRRRSAHPTRSSCSVIRSACSFSQCGRGGLHPVPAARSLSVARCGT